MQNKPRRSPRMQRDTARAVVAERSKEIDMALMEQDVARCHEEISALRDEMRLEFKQMRAEFRADMGKLLQAWNAASLVGKFVKWLAGVVTAAGVIWAVAKGMVGKP